ncbi:MAG: MFS transporter [Thermomicrobiales bacterium]
MITTTRVRERAQGVFYGWWVVSGAFAIQVLLSALLMQSFGAYVPVLQDQFGWSKAQLSAAFSLQRVESGLLGPIQGWMLDRFGPRNVMRVGMLLFGIGLMLFSQINSLTYFYLVFLLIAVGGSLGGFMSLTSTLVNWFVRKRATAMGVAQMGMSVGGLLVPLVAISLTDLGWRSTAFYSGIIVLVVGLPVTQLMRRNPEEYGLLPDGETEEEAAERRARARAEQIESDDIEFAKQAMRTRAFWFISLGHGAAVLVVSAVMVHLIVHLNKGLGYSLRAAATVVSLMTIMQMIGLPVGTATSATASKSARSQSSPCSATPRP